MRLTWIIVLTLFIFWWIDTENSQLIDVLNCAIRRGIYNKSSGKCEIIKLNFVINKIRKKWSEKGDAKSNYTSNKR